ncbi:MAG: type II secretion system F family protein [Alphaproteobacteria bacterium]
MTWPAMFGRKFFVGGDGTASQSFQVSISLIEAGEEAGDLTSSYKQGKLVKYLKWVDAMQTKIRKATRYPMIVTFVVLCTIVFMMSIVVPRSSAFLSIWIWNCHGYGRADATSNFFINPLFYGFGIERLWRGCRAGYTVCHFPDD